KADRRLRLYSAKLFGEAGFAEEAGALGLVVQVIGEQNVKGLNAVGAWQRAFGEDARHWTQIACQEVRGAAIYVGRQFGRGSRRLCRLPLRFGSRLLIFLRRSESVSFEGLHQIVAAVQERAAIRVHVNRTGKNAYEVHRILGLSGGSARQDSRDGAQKRSQLPLDRGEKLRMAILPTSFRS